MRNADILPIPGRQPSEWEMQGEPCVLVLLLLSGIPILFSWDDKGSSKVLGSNTKISKLLPSLEDFFE